MVEAFSPAGGLEYLIPTTRILILEARDFARDRWGYKYYNILDQEGHRILFAAENEKILVPCCCCCTRRDSSGNWSIELYNSQGISIMSGCRTYTQCTCTHYACNCQVAAFGQPIGGIFQSSDRGCCKPEVSTFTIVDGTGTPVVIIGDRIYKTIGNCCCGRTSCSFPLMTINGDPIGTITTFESAGDFANSKFGAEFPVNLDVKIKALLIYATIMIDYRYFDTPPQRSNKK